MSTLGTRLFDMASDSRAFHQPSDFSDAQFNGWSWTRKTKEYVPLYEAKMLNHFDHRFSTYRDATQKQLNKGTLPRLTEKEHDDPSMEPLTRYWVDRGEVNSKLAAKWDQNWLLGWRDIARAVDLRTFVPSVFSKSAVGHKFLLAFPLHAEHGYLLHATWSSIVFDYLSREKISGASMTYFTMKQLACPIPDTFNQNVEWHANLKLKDWIRPYVLELSYTSYRLRPYAEVLGDEGAPFHWNLERRALLRADLDAGFLHIYGLERDESEHLLDSFFVARKYEERDYGEFRTKRLVLGGKAWEPLADPPAGLGPRHDEAGP